LEHATEVALIRRVLAHAAAGSTDRDAPSSSPVERYLSPERFALERDRVLRRLPTMVAAASTLAAPGDFVAHDHTGVPLLVVRGEDGVLRAFLNVCRHRGARVVDEARGRRRAFTCPYHSWTYGLDGALRGLPHPQEFPDLDPAASGLVQVPVAEALGLVWAVPSPGQTFDVRAWLGEGGRDLARFGYDRYVAWDERHFVSPHNWKLAFDANLETYHVQHAHRRTIASLFFDNLLVTDRFGDHQRLVLAKRSILALRDADPALWALRPHANVLYHFFPNVMFLEVGDHATLFAVHPRSPGESLVHALMLIPEAPASDKARAHWDENVRIFWEAIDEDFAMMASIQRGLGSGANRALRFGASEHMAAAFHESVERALARAAA
jgi:phenylpropionate dioxygenase-like ring-hydroxylating dioxygenase large terminal subunit